MAGTDRIKVETLVWQNSERTDVDSTEVIRTRKPCPEGGVVQSTADVAII